MAGEAARIPRRTLLKMAGVGAAGALGVQKVVAGPFTEDDFQQLVPVDKKLSPEWVKSLYLRGKPTETSGKALQHIAMPVGGVCCGLVYLSGDGRVGHWDVFNTNRFGVRAGVTAYKGQQINSGGGSAYLDALPVEKPFDFGFELHVGDKKREMDATGWSDVQFRGQYPVGLVRFKDPSTTLEARLEAFSPFIPLDFDNSSYPLVFLAYTLTNKGKEPVTATLTGRLEHAVGRESIKDGSSKPVTTTASDGLQHGVEAVPQKTFYRSEVLVEDWERDTYAPWTVEGTAFGKGPVARKDIVPYQGNVGGPGGHVVNTHSSAPANDVVARDQHVGKLTGPAFKIVRKYLHFWIGGGNHPGKECLNLIVDGKVVLSQTGFDSNRMRPMAFDISAHEGKTAHIEIIDQETGGWGQIGIGRIWQSDVPNDAPPLADRPDTGTMALLALGHAAVTPTTVSQTVDLAPGESATVEFVVAWHLPNIQIGVPDDATKRHYAKRFNDALAVARHFRSHRDFLVDTTRNWRDTWYGPDDGPGLPHWFMERTIINASTLATSVCSRFGSGRFYGFEGVGCCPGTCGHVWQYAHSVARLFPEIERDTRERVDLGVALNDGGGIGFRAEFDMNAAIDGQGGTVCRILREHQMSPDDTFLRRNWADVKRVVQFLMKMDDGEGIIEGEQMNTLDAAWYGQISWITSEYLAALGAAETMAGAVGDEAFAKECRDRLAKGQKSFRSLFNGEYFIQKPDPKRPDALGYYEGCHVDQVFGGSWGHQVGLGEVLPPAETKQALQSIWKYNFSPDVGPWRDKMKAGRWYAVAGDAGLIMTTNPKNVENPYRDPKGTFLFYFNECWTGQEHQVASHMIANDMVEEGLAITRAVHDRHDASKRNPYNEIECSDHYARAMASHGSFVSLTGFKYDGPSGKLSFGLKAPFSDDDYRFPFVCAEGWGVFSKVGNVMRLEVKHGRLRLTELRVPGRVTEVQASESATVVPGAPKSTVTFSDELVLKAGQAMVLTTA
ncbi:MAG: hypothetical protein KF857_06155 [Fimbriimonadaceae bacterium]|nr:hypothetical protein [Fimbriimonadaceae bacterium]